MSFNKAAQTVGKEAIDKYALAKFEYAKACRRITKLRLLAEAPRASDAEIVAYARARKEHREECKVFNLARAEFTSAMRRLTEPLEQEKDSKFLEPFEDLNIRQLQELRKKEVYNEEMAAGKYDHIIEAAKARMNAGTAREEFFKPVIKSKEPDFTEGFESPFEETKGE